jgi:hypothetical protein
MKQLFDLNLSHCSSKGMVANENIHHTMDHPEEWISFLRENFAIYNNLLGQVIVRFYRQDLSSNKNSFLVYRVFRVFTQVNIHYFLIP